MEHATFAAGCFWGVEEIFRKLPGVLSTEAGYTGGHVPAPTYERVCQGDTGHAEAVHLTFDSQTISYETLVRKFFALHDPTQVNRQGPDIGEQYRSVIFTHSDEQRATAESVKNELDQKGTYTQPIATIIEPAGMFYRAEEYHQRYIEKGGAAACHM